MSSIIFFKGQKCELWPQFSTPVNFDTLWFRNEAIYRISYIFGCADDSPIFFTNACVK